MQIYFLTVEFAGIVLQLNIKMKMYANYNWGQFLYKCSLQQTSPILIYLLHLHKHVSEKSYNVKQIKIRGYDVPISLSWVKVYLLWTPCQNKLLL